MREIFAQALCLPDYRDWSLSWAIIKARFKLLVVFGMLSLAGAFTSIWLFMLAFPPVLGLAIAVGFDLFFAGGIEGGRRLQGKLIGEGRVEARQLEVLAKLDYNGFSINPTFIFGLSEGLWLGGALIERAAGKRIAPSIAVELGQARTVAGQRWIPSANLSKVTRAIEPIGEQFFSIWLEKTAVPYWSGLEQAARDKACVTNG